MADIDVERTRGGSVLPWVLGLLVLALLVWGVTRGPGGDPVPRAGAIPDSAATADTAGVGATGGPAPMPVWLDTPAAATGEPRS